MNFQFRFQLYMINFIPEKKVHFVFVERLGRLAK